MNKTIKISIPFVLIAVWCGICGLYGLLVWGKHPEPEMGWKQIENPVKIYQGRWLADAKKINKHWCLEIIK